MLQTIRNAFKVKDLRDRLIYVFLMLVVIRFGSNLPIPGVNPGYFGDLFKSMAGNDAFGWFNTMTEDPSSSSVFLHYPLPPISLPPLLFSF